MKNAIIFGILFAAIVAIAGATFATVLDDAFAQKGPPPPSHGGGGGPPPPPPGGGPPPPP
jgi:hypothetical protein